MIIEKGTIQSNEKIADGLFMMTFVAEKITEKCPMPGQFLNIAVVDSWLYPLRRPMSIAGLDDNQIKIIYKIFGDGTRLLSAKKPGELLDVLGPIGNSFGNADRDIPILVGGGVGLAPILWLHEFFEKKGIKHHTIIGARKSAEHFLRHEPENNFILTTDDGSLGEKGNVMVTLQRLFSIVDKSKLYACGPEAMLKAVNDFAVSESINCEISVESYMGCATGICQGCVIQRANKSAKKHSYHERYSLVCMDGPVYKAGEVIFQ